MKVARLGYSHTNPPKDSPAGIGGVVAIPGIEDLPDVDLSTPPDDGDVLIWDAGSETWVPGPPGSIGSVDLDDLADVVIATPAENDTLRYIGGMWVNDTRRWEPVTFNFGTGPELVWDGDDLVMEWKAY